MKEGGINEICGGGVRNERKEKVYIKEGKMETRRKNISKMKNKAKESR